MIWRGDSGRFDSTWLPLTGKRNADDVAALTFTALNGFLPTCVVR